MSDTDELDHATRVANCRSSLAMHLFTSLASLDGAQNALAELMFGAARAPEFDRPDTHDGHDELAVALRTTRNALRALAPLLPANAEPYNPRITETEQETTP